MIAFASCVVLAVLVIFVGLISAGLGKNMPFFWGCLGAGIGIVVVAWWGLL